MFTCKCANNVCLNPVIIFMLGWNKISLSVVTPAYYNSLKCSACIYTSCFGEEKHKMETLDWYVVFEIIFPLIQIFVGLSWISIYFKCLFWLLQIFFSHFLHVYHLDYLHVTLLLVGTTTGWILGYLTISCQWIVSAWHKNLFWST